ncbi:hypothetical protein G9A89_019550 [Geosiphon pyriformis]|nr:hypothetical protein G9A89_019550 [Geosiphon pyriformis]
MQVSTSITKPSFPDEVCWQFFRNIVPLLWRDVQLDSFFKVESFCSALNSPVKTVEYIDFIRIIKIKSKTLRAPDEQRSKQNAILLKRLAFIDGPWKLTSFTLDLDFRECQISGQWYDFFQKIGANLEEISLHGSSPFLNDALSTSIGMYCPQLKKLVLESRYFNGNGILHILQSCHLVSLTIWCRQVTGEIILAILEGKSSQSLEHLLLKNCDLDDGPFLTSIPSKLHSRKYTLPELKSFIYVESHLYFDMDDNGRHLDDGNNLGVYNMRFSSLGLLRLLETCPTLEHLALHVSHKSPLIDNESVAKIVEKLPCLLVLEIVNPFHEFLNFDVFAHFNVTVEGLLHSLEKRPNLRLKLGAFDSMV